MSNTSRPRTWKAKFREAISGVRLAVRSQSSFRVHRVMTVLVLIAAAAFQVELWEWLVLIVCIGFVWSAEIMNSAIETLFHALDGTTKNRMVGCLDQAAGSVLIASIISAIVGSIIFLNHLAKYV